MPQHLRLQRGGQLIGETHAGSRVGMQRMLRVPAGRVDVIDGEVTLRVRIIHRLFDADAV